MTPNRRSIDPPIHLRMNSSDGHPPQPRALRYGDVFPHPAPVRCLHIGSRSARILATGGDDRKVHLWAMGEPSEPVLRLPGHISPVSAVALDSTEQMLIAGAMNGALKMWDLEHTKEAIRSLAGHKAAIRCVQFHPFDEFFASGSSDGTLKMWDVRRRGCAQNYMTGHPSGVNVVSMSPDGKWIVTGGLDNTVKLWDLTAGKQLHAFHHETGPITAVTFHPNELLLATAAGDGVVIFWDMDAFKMVSSTPQTLHPVKTMDFSHDGLALLVADDSSLKVYGWEPTVLCDAVDVLWPGISSMRVPPDSMTLVAAAIVDNMVSVWISDLQHSMPEPTPDGVLFKSLTNERPHHQAFQGRSQPSPIGVYETEVILADVQSETTPQPLQRYLNDDPMMEGLRPDNRQIQLGEVQETRVGESKSSIYDDSEVVPSGTHLRSTADTVVDLPASEVVSVQSETDLERTPKLSERRSLKEGTAEIWPIALSAPRAGDRPLGLDIGAFIKRSGSDTGTKASTSTVASTSDSPITPKSHQETLETLTSGHYTMIGVLNQRLDAIRSIREDWDDSNLKPALDRVKSIGDTCVSSDILKILIAGGGKRGLTLDAVPLLCGLVGEMLFEIYEEHIVTACQALKLILKSFGSVILSNIHSQGTSSPGVDISREERVQKCTASYQELCCTQQLLLELQTSPGPMGAHVRDVLKEFQVFRSV